MSHTDRIALSVIIPAYNRAASVGRAIRSVGLTPEGDVELIVVDDGSTDGTALAARHAVDEAGLGDRATIVTQENAGPGAARNHGARLARGGHIAFLDSDDAWFPWTLRVVREAMAQRPEVVIFALRAAYDDAATPVAEERDGPIEAIIFERITLKALGGRVIPASNNLVVKRSAFMEVGGFVESIRCCEDTDLLLRIDRAGPAVLVVEPAGLVYATSGDDRLSQNFRHLQAGLAHLLETEAKGGYPDGAGADPHRTRILANAVRVAAEIALANGHVVAALRLIAAHGAMLLVWCGPRKTLRLLLTPALSALSPKKYRFRLRPAAR